MDEEGRKRKSRILKYDISISARTCTCLQHYFRFMLGPNNHKPGKKAITRPDPPSPRLHRPHALHPILPHVQTPVPSLPPHILLQPHHTPLRPPPRLRQLLVSVRMGTNVLGGNLVMSSGLVGIFRPAAGGFRGGIGHLVVLLSACQYDRKRGKEGLRSTILLALSGLD
jgi:hypothetical protein